MLIVVFSFIFQFGYEFYRYNTLAETVNSAAFYAAMRPYDSPDSTPSSSLQTAVQNIAVYGNPAGGTTPVSPGLTTSNVQFTVTFNGGVPTAMTVAITNYTLSAVFGSMTLTKKPSVTYPYMGVFSPI